MSPIVLVPSVSLGVTMAAIYTGRRVWRKETVEFGTIVNAVLSSAGVVAGALLVASVFSAEIHALINDIELYIAISGLVVLGVSIQALVRDVFGSGERPVKNPKTDTTVIS